jgi:hypothetical protein
MDELQHKEEVELNDDYDVEIMKYWECHANENWGMEVKIF